MQGLCALHWGVRMRACVCMRECKNASFLSLSTPIVMGNSFETGNSNDFSFVAKRCLIKPQRKERKEKRINGKSHLNSYLYNITETVSMRRTIYNTLSAERALLEKNIQWYSIADAKGGRNCDSNRSSFRRTFFRISAVEGKGGMFLDTTICTN